MPATIRKLPPTAKTAADGPLLARPQQSTPPSSDQPTRAAVVAPLAPEHYKLQVTLSAEAYATLRRAQDLMRHTVPTGDLSIILERALTLLVRALEQRKFAATDRPRRASALTAARSRHIPADVRRRVWQRDGGQCAFLGTQGRCGERGRLEFHHVVPYADGGESVVDNLQLRCRLHNAYEAARWDGTLFAREQTNSVQTESSEAPEMLWLVRS